MTKRKFTHFKPADPLNGSAIHGLIINSGMMYEMFFGDGIIQSLGTKLLFQPTEETFNLSGGDTLEKIYPADNAYTAYDEATSPDHVFCLMKFYTKTTQLRRIKLCKINIRTRVVDAQVTVFEYNFTGGQTSSNYTFAGLHAAVGEIHPTYIGGTIQVFNQADLTNYYTYTPPFTGLASIAPPITSGTSYAYDTATKTMKLYTKTVSLGVGTLTLSATSAVVTHSQVEHWFANYSTGEVWAAAEGTISATSANQKIGFVWNSGTNAVVEIIRPTMPSGFSGNIGDIAIEPGLTTNQATFHIYTFNAGGVSYSFDSSGTLQETFTTWGDGDNFSNGSSRSGKPAVFKTLGRVIATGAGFYSAAAYQANNPVPTDTYRTYLGGFAGGISITMAHMRRGSPSYGIRGIPAAVSTSPLTWNRTPPAVVSTLTVPAVNNVFRTGNFPFATLFAGNWHQITYDGTSLLSIEIRNTTNDAILAASSTSLLGTLKLWLYDAAGRQLMTSGFDQQNSVRGVFTFGNNHTAPGGDIVVLTPPLPAGTYYVFVQPLWQMGNLTQYSISSFEYVYVLSASGETSTPGTKLEYRLRVNNHINY
jgi:hypothetical protein